MGIYDIYMGKGIIIPVTRFVRQYLDTVKEFYVEGGDDTETLEKVAKKRLGPDYQVCSLGHDALQSRHNDMPGETVEAAQAFGSTEAQTLINVKLPLALPASTRR